MSKIIKTFTICIILFSFTACQTTPILSSSNSSSAIQNSSISLGNLKLASSSSGAGPYVSSSEGFYQLDIHSDNYQNILYADFSTLKTTYLCARPECLHNDESCCSYIETSDGILPGLVFCEPYLFLVTPTAGENTPPNIQIISKNGLERKTLVEFPSSIRLIGAIYTDGNYLVTLREETLDTATVNYDIIAIDIQNGNLFSIFSLENFSSYICGAFDSTLILKSINPSTKKISFKSINLKSPNGTFKTLELDMSSGIEYISGSYLYLYNPSENSFSRINLITNKTTTVKFNTHIENIGLLYMAGEVFDHQFLFDLSTPETEHSEASVQRYIINFETGTIAPLSLLNGWKRPITIVHELPDALICIVDYSERHLTMTDPLDTNNVMDVISYPPQLAKISKEDYLNSIPNYELFEMI